MSRAIKAQRQRNCFWAPRGPQQKLQAWIGDDVGGCEIGARHPNAAFGVSLQPGNIFRRYAELGSVALLKAEFERAGIVSKRREGADGELSGGKRFSRGALYLMLQNWLYRGNVAHKERACR